MTSNFPELTGFQASFNRIKRLMVNIFGSDAHLLQVQEIQEVES